MIGNFVILGTHITDFADAVYLCQLNGWLWSSFCDKKADWIISTVDSTNEEELRTTFEKSGLCSPYVIIKPGGEITTCIEEIPEIYKYFVD